MPNHQSLFQRLERPATPASAVTSVASHLGKMLSIRAGSVQTLPDYGLPDLNDMNQSLHESLAQSRLLIERFIRAYEPRLKDVRVKTLPRDHDPLALAFAIEATLVIKGTQHPVVFTARLGDSGRVVSVSDRLETAVQPVAGLGAVTSRSLSRAGLPDNARRALQRRFEPLHLLLDEQQNPGGELTQALRLLNELQLQLSAVSRDSSPEQAAFKMARQRMDGQQPLLGNLRDTAARFPQPLKGWFEGIADQSWRQLLDNAYGFVNQHYQNEVYGFYAKAIQRRYPFDAHAGSDVALGDFQAFFKPRGAMARFYESYLRPFVVVEGNRYRLRGIEGRSLPMSRSLLEQLTRAQIIRQGFFTEDQGELAVRFTLAPYSLDQAVSRATLRVGDQQLEYRHGPIVPVAFHWPNEAEKGRSSLVLERGAERPLGIEKDSGAWSLFRFFDLMQSEPASGRDAQVLKADLAGLRANYLLTSQRDSSPFQMATWRTFRLPEQL